jgi:uncharacterized protein (TIGR02246 family)
MTMQKHPLLISVLGLAALSLATALVFAQPKPAATASTPSAVEKAVLETNDKMTRAADSLNAEAFFDYIVNTDKNPVIQNGILFKTRQEALQAVKRGFAGLSKTDRHFDNPQVTVLSPDAALLTSDGTVFATLPDGRTLTNRFAVSLVFVRKEGQWLLLHGHYSTPPNRGQ